MKKILAIIICTLILAFSLTACGHINSAEAVETTVEEYNRMLVIKDAEIMSHAGTHDHTYILVDQETGVCYLYVEGGECNTVTVMLDANGKPSIWPGG